MSLGLLLLLIFILCILSCGASVISRRRRNNEESPWINRDKFLGDIDGYNQATFEALIERMNNWQNHRINNTHNNTIFYSAISNPLGLWLNGRVPYVIDSSDGRLHEVVKAAMKDFHDSTCVRFVPRTSEEDYIRIHDSGSGCSSYLGNIRRGAQGVSLADGCKHKGIALHELMHALGFWHEQQRTDRDDFIIVELENVEHGLRSAYEKAKTSDMNLIGNYDMDSVMHYRYKDFAKLGKTVMRAKHSSRTNFGGEILTDEDKRKIRILYRCNDNKGDTSIVTGVPYFVKPAGTNNCLDVPGQSTEDGVHLQQWDCNQTPAQQWIFTRVNGNVYTIKNAGNGKNMDVTFEEMNDEGGKVQQWSYVDQRNVQQHFKLEERKGDFHITSEANGRIIWVDIAGKLCHWKYDAGQNWKLERMHIDNSGIETSVPYYIKNDDNRCWNAPGGSHENGAHLQVWECNGTPAQQWTFKRLHTNVYAITNVGSRKFADVMRKEMHQQGGKIQQYRSRDTHIPNVQQHFKLEPQRGKFHITSVANGRIIWADTNGKLRHWEYDAGQNWKLERV